MEIWNENDKIFNVFNNIDRIITKKEFLELIARNYKTVNIHYDIPNSKISYLESLLCEAISDMSKLIIGNDYEIDKTIMQELKNIEKRYNMYVDNKKEHENYKFKDIFFNYFRNIKRLYNFKKEIYMERDITNNFRYKINSKAFRILYSTILFMLPLSIINVIFNTNIITITLVIFYIYDVLGTTVFYKEK